jgi:hypothetical protein
LQKIRTEISWTHGKSASSAGQTLGRGPDWRFRAEKSERKKDFRKTPHKPLISLDSHERIQGNPSFSNLLKLGISRQKGPKQENPNWETERRGRPTTRIFTLLHSK